MEDEREEELASIAAIFPELIVSPSNKFKATLDLPVEPASPLVVRFIPLESLEGIGRDVDDSRPAHIEHDVRITHLPPLRMNISLPSGYPERQAPSIQLTTTFDWLPQAIVQQTEAEASHLWEEYGHSATLFAYIDFLQQSAERAFDLASSPHGCLVLPLESQQDIINFDQKTKQQIFDTGTFECGVCLDPKKGSSCYRMKYCSHVFCKACLQSFYINAITEGDVVTVRCLDPECGKGSKRAKKQLHPRELLAIGIEETMARRYVDLKRKKKIESDKNTVYCPRTWCQGPARTAKFPPIPTNLLDYPDISESDDEAHENRDAAPAPHVAPIRNTSTTDSDQRLAVCERCQFAFCRKCFTSWHGPFAYCRPRDPSELSAEDKASYEYIRNYTSPCPTCASPVQKQMGCNHMKCFQCSSHFCYLCGSWLDGRNPYEHFNTAGTSCYQRLWQLEEGDEPHAPANPRDFAAAQDWEDIAVEVARAVVIARDAERGVDGLAAAQMVAEDELAVNAPLDNVHDPVEPIRVVIEGVQLANERPAAVERPRGRGRRQNPFPARARAGDAAEVVRAHERRGQGRIRNGRGGERPGNGAQVRRPTGNAPPRANVMQPEDEIRRFVELAQRDEEDGWDSDDLAGDDEAWRIR